MSSPCKNCKERYGATVFQFGCHECGDRQSFYVKQLQQELTQLKAQLKREQDCVDFYKEGVLIDDLYEDENEVWRIGKMARETVKMRSV